MSRQLSEAEILRAHRIIIGGASYQSAADEMGVTVKYLYNHFSARGLHVREHMRRQGRDTPAYTPARARRIERAVAEGTGIKDACAQNGISYSQLQRWKARGLISLPKGKGRAYHHSDAEMMSAYRRYCADRTLSMAELAALYKISPDRLRQRWRDMGLPSDRERGEAIRLSKVRKPIDRLRAAKAWDKYRRGEGLSHEVAMYAGTTWRRLKATWRDMGYDVDRLIRKRYDDNHKPGAYDEYVAAIAARKERKSGKA